MLLTDFVKASPRLATLESMARVLTHEQLKLQLVPARSDPGSKVLLNPVSQQRAIIPVSSKLTLSKKGWGTITAENGEETKVRDLLAWPV